MAFLLNIETATTVCSVSVSNNAELLACKELDNGFTHAENLHLFIEEVLVTAGITLNAINAVAISRGPGSYTGLRIGVSAAKGLAYALNIPLISVDTLQIMTESALLVNSTADLYCPMIDARRMEVYTRVYDPSLSPAGHTEALIVDADTIKKFDTGHRICFFGDGMPKCREVLSSINGALFIDDIKPSAKHMCTLAAKKYVEGVFEDVAYFEPFYLKDFLILKKKS